MRKNNIPFKVAIGYSTVAIVLILAISLVYSNTKSILAINRASREYIDKRDAADSTMSALLKEEQLNLRQLTDAMARKPQRNYLHDKMQSLNNGKDSVVVKTKAPQTHEAKSTTVEVVKTRKGFFRRLADAFRKEHAETLSVKKDSNRAVVDSIATPVNVAENVADILEQIEQHEKHASRNHTDHVNKELEDLRIVNAQLALRSAKQLNDVHRQERASMQQAIRKAMEARQHLLWQIALLAIVAIVASVILIAYIWRDTRRERLYRENLEQANEEIKRIMNQRERLLLTITHDIKAPAASIAGFIDLMRAYVAHPQGVECLANIKHAAQHLSSLVASLLDYHQLENGLLQVQPTCFSPLQLVRACVEGLRPQAEEKGLEISFGFSLGKLGDEKETSGDGKKTSGDGKEISGDGKETSGDGKETSGDGKEISEEEMAFSADAFRIRQILYNLVSNAIKYTEHGSIRIQATLAPSGPASASTPASASIPASESSMSPSSAPHPYQLTLSVKDTGKGMTTEEKQKAFQAFTRLKNAQGIEGAGLGLSITQELVLLLGGEIHLTSTVGKGSTFTVCLPLLPAEQRGEKLQGQEEKVDSKEKTDSEEKSDSKEKTDSKEKGDSEEKQEAKEAKETKEASEKKLLILDDDKLQLQLLQEMLSRMAGEKWQVFACNHVTEALTLLHNEHPRLMLMDVEMPEMSGMEMIKHINHSSMRVIAMTAHDTSIKPQLLEAGFDDCLFKPFSMQRLQSILGEGENSTSETFGESEDIFSESEDIFSESESKPTGESEDETFCESESKPSRFAPLLAFAGDDEEAASEIVATAKQELKEHQTKLQAFLDSEKQEESSAQAKQEEIGLHAHKLLPLATMLQMNCLEQLQALSPERIAQQSHRQVIHLVQAVVAELAETLEQD